jgi:hypothetical protein
MLKAITRRQAKVIGNKLKVNWRRVDIEEFRLGLQEEEEHSNVVGDDPLMWGRIALVHLKENKHYYTILKEAMTLYRRCSY